MKSLGFKFFPMIYETVALWVWLWVWGLEIAKLNYSVSFIPKNSQKKNHNFFYYFLTGPASEILGPKIFKYFEVIFRQNLNKYKNIKEMS